MSEDRNGRMEENSEGSKHFAAIYISAKKTGATGFARAPGHLIQD